MTKKLTSIQENSPVLGAKDEISYEMNREETL